MPYQTPATAPTEEGGSLIVGCRSFKRERLASAAGNDRRKTLRMTVNDRRRTITDHPSA
jgi:hypothetical protein